MMSDPVPRFYRIFFTVVDPLIALSGVYMMLCTPARVTDAFVPASISSYEPLQTFFQHQLAGALLMCAILDLFLLRRTNEVWIWKTQQAGQLVYDLVMLFGIWFALGQQNRLWPSEYRAEDWGNILIVGTCAMVRSWFCCGIGLPTITRRAE